MQREKARMGWFSSAVVVLAAILLLLGLVSPDAQTSNELFAVGIALLFAAGVATLLGF